MTNQTRPEVTLTERSPWAYLLTLQAVANDTLAGAEWRNDPAKYDYRAALMDESVEARLSAAYKPFWSGGDAPKFDISNLKLELVDILHFLMSEVMQGDTRAIEELAQELAPSFDRGFEKGDVEMTWDPSHIYSMLGELYLKTGSLSSPYWAGAAVYHFGAACGNVEMTFGELYGKYIAKNALNVFRKSIGYKQDKSVKYWQNPEATFFRGRVEKVEDLDTILVDDGDYAVVEADRGERYVKFRGVVVKYSEARVEDNVFVMKMIDNKIFSGEDLLNITYDEMVEVIRGEYTRVTGKAA